MDKVAIIGYMQALEDTFSFLLCGFIFSWKKTHYCRTKSILGNTDEFSCKIIGRKGRQAWLFPVGVSCRGFPSQSVWKMLAFIKLSGQRKTAAHMCRKAAERPRGWF